MHIQFKFIKFVIQKYKLRSSFFVLTIVLAAFLELSLVSFIYFLTSILLGNNEVGLNILGFEIKLDSFNIWFIVIASLATVVRIAIIIFQANNIAVISTGVVKLIYSKIIWMPLT
ncbi:MAG: hypothetical protein CBB97_02130, partial [Candidatus Endolissoclinum sp. TMED37]